MPTSASLTRQIAGLSLIAAATATLLLGFAARPAAPAADPTPLSVSTPARAEAGCWVSGDLVGEANPAVVAAALCGR